MSFDTLAPHYDWMEALLAGRRLERARAAQLDALAGRRRVLSAGEGHGRFAAACLRRHPEIELTCVDASAAMLARGRRRVARVCGAGGLARTRWVEATLPGGWPPTDQASDDDATRAFDAIATCFFLDCFPPETLAAVVRKLAARATPDAVWLVVDFAVPERGAARWRARAVHSLMYSFFRLATRLPARRLTPPDAALEAAGFRREARREFEWGLVRSEVWRRHAPAHSSPSK